MEIKLGSKDFEVRLLIEGNKLLTIDRSFIHEYVFSPDKTTGKWDWYLNKSGFYGNNITKLIADVKKFYDIDIDFEDKRIN